MDIKAVDELYDNPAFQELVKRRRRFIVKLSALMLGSYGLFVFGLAFFPSLFAYPVPFLDHQVIPLGIPFAIGIILFAFVLTGVYVYRANTAFDALTEELRVYALKKNESESSGGIL